MLPEAQAHSPWIVFLNPIGQMGGAETCLVDIIWSLHSRFPSWHLHVIAGMSGPLSEYASKAGASVTVLEMPIALASLGDTGKSAASKGGALLSVIVKSLRQSRTLVGYCQSLRRLLQSLSAGIIHTNGFKMHALAALVAPRKSIIVWHIHDYVSNRPLMSRVLQLLQFRCSAIVTNSASVTSDVRSLLRGKTPITTILNAVDLKRFSPVGRLLDLDHLSGLAPIETPVIRVGLVATFARWKGHEVFLKAIALLPKQLAVRAYIIGAPVYSTAGSQYSLEQLRSQARQLGIEQVVGFTGYIHDTASAMRSLDIVVHASTDPEPFGLVIAEAMACGKPVIVSFAGGACELVESERNALVHSPGDVPTLALQLERLIRDTHLRTRLGMEGRRTAERMFNRERLANELAHVYGNLVPVDPSMSDAHFHASSVQHSNAN